MKKLLLITSAFLIFTSLQVNAQYYWQVANISSISGGGTYNQNDTPADIVLSLQQCSGGISQPHFLTNYTLSWYVNSTNSNTGGTLISSSNMQTTANFNPTLTFTPPTNVIGTFYYYAELSNPSMTTCGFTTILTSSPEEVIINCPTATGTDTRTECNSYTWIDGNNYTTSNNTATHTIVGGAVNGCDSIVTLDLTINHSNTGTDVITATACDGYTWIDGNIYTASNSTATHTLQNAAGCDSVVTLNLTIISLDQTVNATNLSLCPSNTGTTINTGGSTTGFNYYLRDNENDTIVSGPLAGTGSGLSLNTGTITNNMTYNVYAAQLKETAVSFDQSVPENITIPSSPDFDFAQGTIEMWIKPEDNTNLNRAFIALRGGNGWGSTRWSLHMNVNQNSIGMYNGYQFQAVYISSGLNTGQWYHVAIVINATFTAVFVDGVYQGAVSLGMNTGPTGIDLTIGNNGDPAIAVEGFIGAQDDVRIWNTARTNSQINNFKDECLEGTESGLVALYSFEDGLAKDLTGNGHDGIAIGIDLVNDTVTSPQKCFTCGTEMTNTVSVTLNSTTSSTLDSTICFGESFVVNGTTYDGTNTTGIETITGSNGCDSVVTVSITELPEKSGTQTETICFGESIEVNGTTYDASNLTGTEVFTNVGPYGCDSTVTVNLIIEDAIDVSTTTTELTITANQVGATYQWIDCDNGNTAITDATNASYTAEANGNYAVVVTVGNCSDTSDCVTISTVSLAEQVGEINLSIFPNPATSTLTIENEGLKIKTISIVDITGKIIETLTGNTSIIDVSVLNKGIYFLQIDTDKGLISKKFIKD